MSRTTLWAGVGGVTAAVLGSLCCMGPLVFVTLGVGAGLATTFEPLRPVFELVMVALFGLAFYSVYGRCEGRRWPRVARAPSARPSVPARRMRCAGCHGIGGATK